MITVALVAGRLNVGGAEGELVRLANGLPRDRFRPFVATLLDAGPLAARLAPDVEVVALGRRSKWLPGTARALRDLLRSRKPEVVQSFLFAENVHCRRAGVGAVVSGIQGSLSERDETGPWAKRWLERRTFRRAAAAVANSAYYRDLWGRMGMDASRIRVVRSAVAVRTPSGRDLRRTLGIGPDEVVATVVARLVPLKGHEEVLRAAPGRRLLFAGDGPLRPRLEGRGATILGNRDDVPDLLAASNMVVLASRFGESCPNALLEAMAAGLPVVATRTGGVPEIVTDGENGFLVRPGDVAGLGEAIRRLAADPELRRRMGAAGRARVLRDHDPARFVDSYAALYNDLTAGASNL